MIKLQNVSKKFYLDGETTFVALQNINTTIQSGEYVAVVGQSGSGKSTLMHIIGLLDSPTEGQMFINEKDISRMKDDALSTLRNEFVGFVFQQFSLINKLTVMENILLPAMYVRKKLEYDPYERAVYLVKRFGLEGKELSYPNKISGGQQQRVAIARALIMNPDLVLADEPTGNLDTKTGEGIMELLEELNKTDKKTIVLVTHDSQIAKRARRIIRIRDGQIV